MEIIIFLQNHRIYQAKQDNSADKTGSNFDLIIMDRTINPNTQAAHETILRMKVRFQPTSHHRLVNSFKREDFNKHLITSSIGSISWVRFVKNIHFVVSVAYLGGKKEIG